MPFNEDYGAWMHHPTQFSPRHENPQEIRNLPQWFVDAEAVQRRQPPLDHAAVAAAAREYMRDFHGDVVKAVYAASWALDSDHTTTYQQRFARAVVRQIKALAQ